MSGTPISLSRYALPAVAKEFINKTKSKDIMSVRKTTTSILLKPANDALHAEVRPIQAPGLPKAHFNPLKKVANERALVKLLVESISKSAAGLVGFQTCGK